LGGFQDVLIVLCAIHLAVVLELLELVEIYNSICTFVVRRLNLVEIEDGQKVMVFEVVSSLATSQMLLNSAATGHLAQVTVGPLDKDNTEDCALTVVDGGRDALDLFCSNDLDVAVHVFSFVGK